MYRSAYAEVLADDGTQSRRDEAMAFSTALHFLRKANGNPQSADGVRGLEYARRLWEWTIEQVSSDDSVLPLKLRGDIASIGIGCLKTIEGLRNGTSGSMDHLIDVMASMRQGLEARS